MSRIRSIHPGLWTDDAFMSLSAYARLLAIGLWNEAYDDGVFEWKPRTLKARLFPNDLVDVEQLLAELVAADFIREGAAVGKPYGLIRNFRIYQRPKKPNSSGMLRNEDREYVGLVENQSGTGGEKSPQMEDGGGRVEEKEEPKPLAQQPAAARREDFLDRLLEAAGVKGNPPTGLAFPGEIHGLVLAGFDLEADILPAMRAKPNPNVRSWGYYVPIIREAVERRQAVASVPRPQAPSVDWAGRMKVWKADRTWSPAWGPKPGEPGCKAPAEIEQAA